MGFYEEIVFPWLLERVEGPEVWELRRRCVEGASGEVLEIGFGTGKTMPYYTDAVSSLTALEPVAGMGRKARERIAASRVPVTPVQLAGEALPFDDAHFDAVVVTMALCSVMDPAKVLAEMLRVLKPGGRYHFLEHVASEDPKARRMQDRLTPLHRIVGCGCHLNRETADEIERAGFRVERIERHLSDDMPLNAAWYPVILGVATKP